MIIRPAVVADASALARLRYDFRATLDPAREPEADFLMRCTSWMTARLVPGGCWRCWVLEEADQLLGTIWLQLIEKIPNPVGEQERHAYVTSVYVDPSLRGAGLGGRLLETCLHACAAENVDAVILWPSPRSRTLYERHGFGMRDDLFERRLSKHLLIR